jgi:hypothetical protein
MKYTEMNVQDKLVELCPLIKITSSHDLKAELSQKFNTENNLAIMIQKNVRRFLAMKKLEKKRKESNFYKKINYIFTCQSNFRRLTIQKKIKYEYMLKKIIEDRSKALNIILKKIRVFNSISRMLQYALIKKIHDTRLNAITTIQRIYKGHLIDKEMKNILSKESKFYSLTYPFKANSVKIKIFISKDDEVIEKEYAFNYCKLRKIFVLYINPDDFSQGIYRVSFIVDDIKTCDGRFPHIEFSDGNYYSVIEFRLPWEKKAKAEENLQYMNTSTDIVQSQRQDNEEDISELMIRSKSNSIDENLVNDLKDSKAIPFMEVTSKYNFDFN